MLRRIILVFALTAASIATAQTSTAPSAPPVANDSGMHVILLGTGYPRPYPDRAGPCTSVVVNGKVFFVDAGRGVMMRGAGAHLPLGIVTAGFLTQLNSDHTNGLPRLFYTTSLYGRQPPPKLYL